ncbi:hypothetical protein BD769DRAFT_1385584 [Suillus cothurnatus]|nr:hypothetical protein BD769DRAFT_1385584 [Suillus cothurnatus]
MYASGLSVSEAGVMHMGAGMQGKQEHNGLNPKSGNQPMNGPAQVQCPYLANATLAVMQINPASTINRHREKGDWQESIHLSGAVYYYNDKTMLLIKESHKVIMNTSTTMVNPRCQKNIYVDGLMNGVDVRGFMDDFIAQAKSQTTVVFSQSTLDCPYLQGSDVD